MNDTVTIIDIVAQVTDETGSGAKSAQENVSKLEKSMMNLQKQIQSMKGKSKLEVAATLKDMASKGIQNVAAAGKKIAGKVWTVTLKAVDLVTAPFKKVFGLLTSPVTQMAAFAGVSFGLADTINTFKDFEQGMANVKSITGTVADKDLPGVMQAAKDLGIAFEEGSDATETSMNILTATAKHLGETTMFSAAQAAEAMENLAMAGWKAEDITRGMPGLLDLAAAGSVDLATAADVTASALAQFKMEAGEAGRVADVLAATATNSKTDVAGLGESLKYAGSLAGALGYSIEDVSVAFGLMGNAAIDGSSAGTALRATLARMSKQEGLAADESNAVVDAMRKLGVSMTDDSGKAKSLMTIMKDMRTGYAKLSEAEQTATMTNLAGQNALSGMLAIVQASDEDFNKLTNAINNSSGAAAKMAGIKMDTLQGSLYYLQSAAEGVKIAVGEKLQPYVKGLVDWVTAHMPDIQNAVESAVDFVTGKIDGVIESVKSLTGSQEWQNAETLWDKIKLAWDKLIAEPFDKWWSGTGKTWLADKANSIGEGLGTAIKTGILALFGVDVSSAATEGADIGKSFFDGFMKGFDWSEVSKRLGEALKNGLKFLVKDAAALLPGGKEASGTSALSAAALGYGAFKAGQVGRKVYKGGKAVMNGAKAVRDVASGVKTFNAAANGSHAADAALSMAQSGQFGIATKLGTTIAPAVNKLAKAVPVLAGVTSAIQMTADAYKGTKKAREWTGSDSTGNKVASGIGAALGGLGDGILGNESVGRKVSNVAGGALKGAGIGAAVGSILPGVGTAVGGAVGAGIGAAGATIGGSNIAKALSKAGTAVKGFFTETVPEKFGDFAEGAKSFYDNSVAPALKTAGTAVNGFFTETVPEKFGEFAEEAKGFFTETVPQALNSAGRAVKGFFTETVPEKFEELVTGARSFLTETVPFAIGYAAGKIQVFFTETVPEFFGSLWDGITNFFTTTVPAAVETVGSALSTFFTETVPDFFSGLWDSAAGFFTGTVPAAIEAVGGAVTAFFTETVPQFFGNLWEGITAFFTETVPSAIDTVGGAVNTFFTETVPKFFSNLWDGIVNFFTQAVPKAISSVGESVSGFFSNVKEKITGFFSGIWGSVTSNASAGHQAATAHAEGGIMTTPHVGLVAEDGAEAIIPLSGKRRDKGIALWEKTGELLGVKPYADGGIVGAPLERSQSDNGLAEVLGDNRKSAQHENSDGNPQPDWSPLTPVGNASPKSGNMAVYVDIGNLTYEINVNGGDASDAQALADIIQEKALEMTDEIAYRLAVGMKQAFANTPKEQWGS